MSVPDRRGRDGTGRDAGLRCLQVPAGGARRMLSPPAPGQRRPARRHSRNLLPRRDRSAVSTGRARARRRVPRCTCSRRQPRHGTSRSSPRALSPLLWPGPRGAGRCSPRPSRARVAAGGAGAVRGQCRGRAQPARAEQMNRAARPGPPRGAFQPHDIMGTGGARPIGAGPAQAAHCLPRAAPPRPARRGHTKARGGAGPRAVGGAGRGGPRTARRCPGRCGRDSRLACAVTGACHRARCFGWSSTRVAADSRWARGAPRVRCFAGLL